MLKSLGEFFSSWTDIDILPKGYRHRCVCISLDIAFPFLLISRPIHRLSEKVFVSIFNVHPPLSLWHCVVYGQKSDAHCSLFSDAEWIAHSEQLCHSSQHPSLPPSHPSVTLHGVQRHHVGLCDRPHMAAAQWQCSLSPQLWHHHPAGLQERGCHAKLRPSGRRLGSVTVLVSEGGGVKERNWKMGLTTWTFSSRLSLNGPKFSLYNIYERLVGRVPKAHILLLRISISHLSAQDKKNKSEDMQRPSRPIWSEQRIYQ